MRSRCSTGSKSVDQVPPTTWVGESGVRSDGWVSSSASSSCISASNSASLTDGASLT